MKKEVPSWEAYWQPQEYSYEAWKKEQKEYDAWVEAGKPGDDALPFE